MMLSPDSMFVEQDDVFPPPPEPEAEVEPEQEAEVEPEAEEAA